MRNLGKFLCAGLAVLGVACRPAFVPETVPDAGDRLSRVEPPSWWTGMKTPLQLLLHGEGLGSCTLEIEGEGVRLGAVRRAESPNYLFAEVKISPSARPGTRYLVFTDTAGVRFKFPYELAARRPGSALREGFSSADLVYLLMPDRFADGEPANDATPDTAEKPDRSAFFGRHGGDIQGILAHLDYIADLGATALWSTPLLLDDEPAGSYHGYACADYYRIDPRFGSNALYREMVARGHRLGLKTLMDAVPNHCGAAHWWMKDLPFRDWIHRFEEYTPSNHLLSAGPDPNVSEYDLHRQESGWFDVSMPDMNLDNPYVLRYFQQWAVWWIEYADLDGLRVDTYPYNEKEPMSRWCAALLAEYPRFNIVGECWTVNVPQLAYWQGGNPNRDGFDSHLPSIMDFPLREAICRALASDGGGWGEGLIRVYEAISNDFVYHDLSKMLIFTANHDTDRIADLLGGDLAASRLAMTLLATLRGIPEIFCGDELLFRSKDLSQGHGGLRVDFPGGWAGDETDLFDPAQRGGEAAELHDFCRRLFQWRKGKAVLHHGRTLHFAGRDDTYAFFRYDDREAVFVFLNAAAVAKRLPWSHYAEFTSGLSDGRDALTGQPVTLSDETTVDPRSALIVEYRRDPAR